MKSYHSYLIAGLACTTYLTGSDKFLSKVRLGFVPKPLYANSIS